MATFGLMDLEKIDFKKSNLSNLEKIHDSILAMHENRLPHMNEFIKEIKLYFAESKIDIDSLDQEETYRIIARQALSTKGANGWNIPATTEEIIAYALEINRQVFTLGPLDALLKDDDVTDIIIHTFDNISIARRTGSGMEKYGQHFASEEQMRSILTNVLSRYSGVQVDQSRPIGDGVLPNGERVLVVIPPVAPNGTVCVIRKQAKSGFTPEQLVEFKSFSPQVGDFMRIAVRSEANLVVVGPTGSGKTALVSALLNYIPLNQHLLTIEDTMELQIPELRSVFTQYKTRSNPEQPDYDVTIYSLLRASLRSFPKYLIVGETRGEEAWEMLQAMKSGHAGITTIHGKDGPEAISRLEGMMALADNSMDMNYLRKDIAQVMDLFIIQRWIGREELGSERRGIYAIYEITPTLEKENLLLEDMIPDSSALTQEKIMSDNPRFVQTYGAATLRKLFYYSYDEDKLLPGVLPSASLVEKFREHGLYDDYRRAFELD